MTEKKKDLFPTRRLEIKGSNPYEDRIVIQHDLSDAIRKAFDLDDEEQDKPGKVIPFKR